MKKKLIVMTLALATCVCGCGSTTTTETETVSTTTSTEAETTTETTETETITVTVTGYDVDNLYLFKGTTLYLECEVNGEIEIHHFNEEWIPNCHLTEVEVITNGNDDPKDWEVVPPTDAVMVSDGN